MLAAVLKENISTLQNLCSLYHISSIVRKCLQSKVDYQYSKSHVRDLLFNPYSHLEESSSNPQQADEGEEESKVELKRKLTELSTETLKAFTSSVDTAKLQSAITKAVQLQVEPLTKQCMLFAADIPELQPTVDSYLAANLATTSPLEFVYFLKRCPEEGRSLHIRNYLSALGQYMDLQETAALHLQLHSLFQYPITIALLKQLVEKTNSITYAEFLAVGRLMERLAAEEKGGVGDVLRMVKDRMGEGEAGESGAK